MRKISNTKAAKICLAVLSRSAMAKGDGWPRY